MATIVAGDMYQKIDGQLFEIKRQLRQSSGYPFDPERLSAGLQKLIEGRFGGSFKASETNLDEMISQTEEYTQKILGVTVDLRKMFKFPEELPWKNVLVIFDPGFLTNRDAVKKALQGQSLKVWEEVDVMQYSGSEVLGLEKVTLHIIENSLEPNLDTMNKSPNELVATSQTWLTLRGYALAFSLRHFMTEDLLDSKTWTWFPNNHLPSGGVTHGCWYPGVSRVEFGWHNSGYRDSRMGARLAIPVPLVS